MHVILLPLKSDSFLSGYHHYNKIITVKCKYSDNNKMTKICTKSFAGDKADLIIVYLARLNVNIQ